jgi:hypothetical protein
MTGLTLKVLFAATLTIQAPATSPVTSVDSLRSEMTKLASKIASQEREVAGLAQEGQRREFDAASGINAVSAEVIASRNLARRQSEEARNADDSVAARINAIDSRLRTLFGLALTTLVALLFGAIGLIVAKGRRGTDSNHQLLKTSALLEESRAALPEPRLSTPISVPAAVLAPPTESSSDHALAIHVSDEIHRMRIRLSQLVEPGTATKALKRSVDRIEESLNEAGYSIPDLIGKTYHDGMTLDAHFIADEALVGDERVIGRIIRPQVNFHDLLIQPAEVEVRTGIPRHTSPTLVS